VKLSLTTPKGALVDTDVEEITAPGEVGEFGILPGHIPLMAALKPGVFWYKTKDHAGVVAIGHGYLQVAPLPQADEHAASGGRDRVLVFVDQALTAGDVDSAVATKGELDGAYDALVLRRGWAQARIDAAARGNPPH